MHAYLVFLFANLFACHARCGYVCGEGHLVVAGVSYLQEGSGAIPGMKQVLLTAETCFRLSFFSLVYLLVAGLLRRMIWVGRDWAGRSIAAHVRV
jgi:hypothetical protein